MSTKKTQTKASNFSNSKSSRSSNSYQRETMEAMKIRGDFDHLNQNHVK